MVRAAMAAPVAITSKIASRLVGCADQLSDSGLLKNEISEFMRALSPVPAVESNHYQLNRMAPTSRVTTAIIPE